MSQKSFYFVGLIPLFFALLYFQLDNLTSVIDNASNLLKPRPVRSETPVIMACHAAFSHMEKITTIAQGLMMLGYPVTFITGPEFKDYVEKIGATFIPIEGQGNQIMSDEDFATFVTLSGADLEVFAFKNIFIKTMPAQHRTLQRTFSAFREKYGKDQKIVLVSDSSFAGPAPVLLGAPGIRPDIAIGVGLAPYVGSSNDTFPFRSGIYPDTTSESQRIHWEAQKAQYESHPIDTPVNEAMRTALKEMGAKQETASFYDALALAPDVYLQYGIPAFEYKRSDWRPNLEFIGAPVAVGIADRELPDWWDDVLEAKKAGKHIVAVSSSTVVYDTKALIKPAMEAFGGREDVFFMATLVTSEVDTLDFEIPANARVAKFIPLDLILPHVSVLVTNAGYGTVQQSLRAGVPMIISGTGQDKLHTGALVNYTGVGIYHAVPQVTARMLTDAFDEMTSNKTYSSKLSVIKNDYDKYNAIDIVDKTIQKALVSREWKQTL